MLNIVMPMAGRGSRFYEAGFTTPKPLIPIHGIPMIEVVIANLRPSREHRFIFLCLEEHVHEYGIDKVLKKISPGCDIIMVDKVTEGAACTVLLAKELINDDYPLMIANCDQWVDISIDDYLSVMDDERTDGLIMTMWADHPKWSYVRFSDAGYPCEVVEKRVVSNEATVGIYNYRKGSDFVWAAETMIEKNFRVNNEFYVAPAYNELIAKGLRLSIYNVGKVNAGMYGLGIPSDLGFFISHSASQKAVAQCGR